ncbi:MAG: zinc dependent phospholipase C family protein [Defluviitaleaceae bacterium]|nr:zinc dependent phospholipase C family protein [Defluviitaleaceae bacterium]
MPGFITHYICGEAALKSLPAEIGETLYGYRQLYNIGTQGPDIFFYYFPGFLKKNMKNLGSHMHRANFSGFISGMLNGMEGAGDDAGLVFSYIAGFLTHYTLDYNAHPYVYYKSGFKAEGDKKSKFSYSVDHRSFETAIDVLMLKLMSGERPADKKLWQLIRTEAPEAREVSKVMSQAINNAYGCDVSEKEIYKAMKYMVNITRLLQSRRGRRKKLMELSEELTVGEHAVSSLIHSQSVGDGVDYLNIGRKPWNMPWDNKTAVESSFPELYNRAVAEAVNLIVHTDMYRKGELGRDDLLAMIGNRSLASGVDSDEDVEFLYHE